MSSVGADAELYFPQEQQLMGFDALGALPPEGSAEGGHPLSLQIDTASAAEDDSILRHPQMIEEGSSRPPPQSSPSKLPPAQSSPVRGGGSGSSALPKSARASYGRRT